MPKEEKPQCLFPWWQADTLTSGWTCWPRVSDTVIKRDEKTPSETEEVNERGKMKGGKKGRVFSALLVISSSFCLSSSLIFFPRWRAKRRQGCCPRPGQVLSAWDNIPLISPPHKLELHTSREQVSIQLSGSLELNSDTAKTCAYTLIHPGNTVHTRQW